jgi:phenylalanyl-tRNA synthetase beta chain
MLCQAGSIENVFRVYPSQSMKISYNWLKKYLNTDLSAQELAEKLTSVGLEVEEVHPYSTVPEGLENLTIGLVKEVSQHPNADRLRLTKVDVGGAELLNIVCGAPNVAAGQKVVVATEGTTIHPLKGEPFIIKRSKIRGEASEGMICAEDEIGIGSDHNGIMVLKEDARIGAPFSEYMPGYKDWIIEIGLTPNRVDAASHIGVARDLAALLNISVQYPKPQLLLDQAQTYPFEIKIEDTEACPRYSGLIIQGITVKESPEWLRNCLKVIGLNPINNIVDATNFVLHELGHPLHAFDLAKIKGNKIIVRRSEKGAKFTTLDKQERELDGTELMICNAGEPMALAGIFGGLESGISSSTTDIFIESAYFNPSVVRKAARRHGLFTDASFRFERGADPNGTLRALNRVASLIIEIAGGNALAPVYDEYPQPIQNIQIRLDYSYLNSIAGDEIPKTEVSAILKGLEMNILAEDEKGLLLEVPSFKSDVKRPVDLVEEVLRIYSFDRIPFGKRVKSVLQVDPGYHSGKRKSRISQFLADKGVHEAYILSFVKEEDNALYSGQDAVKVLNPLSADLAEVRNNLLIPGLRAIAYNLNRQQKNVSFFKWGHTHHQQENGRRQDYHLSMWFSGSQTAGNWHTQGRPVDFYELKAIVDQVCAFAKPGNYKTETVTPSYASYAMQYTGASGEKQVGFGKVSEKLLRKLGIEQEVFYADFDASWLLEANNMSMEVRPISRFPKVERDLALQVPENLQYADIRNLIASTEKQLLKRISIFDVYEGKQLATGLKSYAIRLEFEDMEQTLEDKTIDQLMQKIIKRLDRELNVQIRS